MARPGDGEWQHAEVGARAGTARLAGRGGGRAGRAGPGHQLPGRAGSSGPRGGEARGGRAVLAGRRSLAHALSARRLEPLRGGVGGGGARSSAAHVPWAAREPSRGGPGRGLPRGGAQCACAPAPLSCLSACCVVSSSVYRRRAAPACLRD